jgi:hypothetical protein
MNPPWSSRIINGSATPLVKKTFVYVTLPLTILVPPVGCPDDEAVGLGVTFGKTDEHARAARLNADSTALIRTYKGFISLSSDLLCGVGMV